MYEKYYDVESFPVFNYYVGDPAIYLVFLVLRFYDDDEDFKRKIRSMFPFVRVVFIRRPPKLWEKILILKNTINGQMVELSKKDDPFTTAIKIFRLVAGPEWLQDLTIMRAFEEILPKTLWFGLPLVPHY